MKQRLLVQLLRSLTLQKTNQGFVLSLSIGLGTAVLILALTSLMLTQHDLKFARSRQHVNKCLMVAESAAYRILGLLSRHENSTFLGQNYDPINPGTGKNFLGADGEPNSGDETSTAVNYWTGVSPILLNGNIGSNNSYILKAYRYDEIRQQATLLIEGCQGLGKSTLVIRISIGKKPVPTYGLWIQSHSDSDASSDVRLETNIQDSTPPNLRDANDLAKITAQQLPIPPSSIPPTINDTPGVVFPALPLAANTPPISGPGVYTLSRIDNATPSLPRMEDTPNNGVIIYHLTDASKSIDLSGTTLNLGSGNETIILYLESGISLSGGSQIRLAPGSKLIIYTRQNISLSGGSQIIASSDTVPPSDLQIYLSSTQDVSLSGSSRMQGFLFAPEAVISFSDSSIFQGVIWARAWQGSGGSISRQQELDLSQTGVSGLPGTLQIKNIVFWKRE